MTEQAADAHHTDAQTNSHGSSQTNSHTNSQTSAHLLEGRWTRSRPLTPADNDFAYALAIDPNVGGAVRLGGAVPSPEQFHRAMWDSVLGQWVVTSKDGSERLGIVVISSPDLRNGFAHLSVMAVDAHLRSGVIIDGLAAVIDFAFASWPFRMLYSEMTEDNYAKVASAVDRFFEREGCRKAQQFQNGRYQDVHLLTLTRERWAVTGRPLRDQLVFGDATVADAERSLDS